MEGVRGLAFPSMILIFDFLNDQGGTGGRVVGRR
jgi:hypothetical protein